LQEIVNTLFLQIILYKTLFATNFCRKYLQILLWKKTCKKLLTIFLKIILYKTLFATNFVGNTCKFYNFVGNKFNRLKIVINKIFGN